MPTRTVGTYAPPVGAIWRGKLAPTSCLELQRELNETFEKHAVFNGLLDARGVGATRSDVARVAS
jgi:hypothetical protein